MSCHICESKENKIESNILTVDGSIRVCSNCKEEVYTHGLRQDVDIAVVPIKEDSFGYVLKHKKYVAPSNYMARNPKMIAFYRPRLNKITHIAIISNIERHLDRNKIKKYAPKSSDAHWMTYDEFMLISLEKTSELEEKIDRTNHVTIQNRIYVKFNDFIKSKTILDLFS